jgi:hypothetical protein
MRDIQAICPIAATDHPRPRGAAQRAAEELVALDGRRERGRADRLTDHGRRALLVRWPAAHGHPR